MNNKSIHKIDDKYNRFQQFCPYASNDMKP